MVKISNSFVLIAALRAAEDGDAMLQVVKQAPALAQTASAVRASRHQQAHQMESNFEKLAAEAVRTGETPSLGADVRTAVNSALQTLEDELKMEKDANDAEMDGAISQFAACNTKREKSFIDVDRMNSTVEEAKKKHAECRLDFEDPNCGDEKTKCDGQDEYARDAHDAGPHCVCEAFGTAGTQKVCLDRAVEWGAEYNTALGKKITACDVARANASEVAQVCDHDQVTFEMAVCLYKTKFTTACEGHSACYEAAVSNRDTVEVNVKLKEASEKIMWKSCQKVRCYLDMLDATEESTQVEFTKCQEQDANTTHLDIIYLDSPEMADCETTAVITDPDWVEAEYAKLQPTKIWLPKRKGIEHVTPCTQQTSLVLPTDKTRLGESGGGIFKPQPMIVEPQPMIVEPQPMIFKPQPMPQPAVAAAATTQYVDFGGDNSAYFSDGDQHQHGCAKGWTCEGNAEMSRFWGGYREVNGEKDLSTYGKYHFSMGGGSGLGKMTSAPFQLPATAVKAVLWRSGGAGAPSGLKIKNASDNTVICEAEDGTKGWGLEECELAGYGGTIVYIVMEDRMMQRSWGQVFIDDIQFKNAAGEVVVPDYVSTDVAYTESVSTRCDNNPGGHLKQYNTVGKCRDACSEDLSCSAFTYPMGISSYCVLINNGAVCNQIGKAGKTRLFVKAA